MADRAVLRVLGWTPDQAITLIVVAGSIVAVPDPCGSVAISTDGHLRLPVGLRRRCGLATGDRVLLAADAAAAPLLLHPQATLNAVLAAHHATALRETTR